MDFDYKDRFDGPEKVPHEIFGKEGIASNSMVQIKS